MWTLTADNDQNLILIKTDEIFDFDNLLKVLGKIYLDNDGMYSSYDRFVDLSDMLNIDVDLNTSIETIQNYRKVNPPKDDVKIAVYSPSGMMRSFAQVFKIMVKIDSPRLKVSSSLDECADYLSINTESLQF